MKNNIVLIGMPGVGKSTIGVILAKILGYRFIDSDLVIQEETGKLLRDIIEEQGVDGFIRLENQICGRINEKKAVIATGGSVVYGEDAMRHLKETGTIIYLDLDYNYLKKRLGNIKNRGVVTRNGQSLKDLYENRLPLYKQYCDILIDENDCNIEETVKRIVKKLEEYPLQTGKT